jgi:type III secretion protein X
MALDILNVNIGLQSFLEPTGETRPLPEARVLPQNVVNETGLDRHFDLTGLTQLIDKALTPLGVDERLLRPEVFRRNLTAARDKLKDGRQKEIRAFVRDDLAPLLEDGELYVLYASLLVGG